MSTSRLSFPLIVLIGVLLMLCITSASVATYLGFRLLKRRKQTSLDIYSVYSSSLSMAGRSASAPVYGGFPRHPYVHHLDDGYR
ncbi:hypothetical protein Y032_0743g1990 [Ancylostoma ceylanicum]|uniref:Uncharacterized protein n=1 Tax=Ancylostoma ceylanicum TaxID=53326 RepID=A0A016WET6_9BILA|nr:hypothetical protein Y032_0743g1990 [Ancylostoma ceylanicum]